MPLIQNYVRFGDGVTHTMRLADHAIVSKTIRDPVTGWPHVVRSLVFRVTELDGQSGEWTWSILSEKLAAAFEPLLPGKEYRGRRVRVTQTGTGFLTNWTVEWLPG